jgi:hypothetical protein
MEKQTFDIGDGKRMEVYSKDKEVMIIMSGGKNKKYSYFDGKKMHNFKTEKELRDFVTK